MAASDPFAAVAAQEELVAEACVAVASWVPDAANDLHTLAEAHRAVARAMAARSRRWLKLRATLRATIAAAIGTDLGALVWLRAQEQRLIDHYMMLEGSTTLSWRERRLLRRELVPAAFERFQRVDQWIMLREERGAFA